MQPIPDGTELEERILTALRDASGSRARNEFRSTVNNRLPLAALNNGLASLHASDRISVKVVTREQVSLQAMVTACFLAEDWKRTR